MSILADSRLSARDRSADRIPHSLQWLSGLLLCLSLWLQHSPAQAAIYACPGADGGTVFQDRPCAIEKRKEPSKTKQVRQPPLGIHPSWFSRPEHTSETAYCDKRACECLDTRRKHDGGIELAVADALYIDGSWHRYENTIAAWQKTQMHSASHFQLQGEVQEAACDVLMSQQTLMQFAVDSMRTMRQQARDAEDRGHDDATVCGIDENGAPDDANACEHFNALELYRRMVVDAKALSLPRIPLNAADNQDSTTAWDDDAAATASQ